MDSRISSEPCWNVSIQGQGWAKYGPMNIFVAHVYTVHTFSIFCADRVSLTYLKLFLLEKHAV